MSDVLTVRGLTVVYPTSRGELVHALTDISLSLARGEAVGIVGESGSGKTTLARTLTGLTSTASVRGHIVFEGEPLPITDEAAMRAIRWRKIALSFQGASSAFDPVYRVGDQVMEPILEHLKLAPEDARRRALLLWRDVDLPADRFERYPHELSGGEKQRAMLAMALACDPALLIVDEPTSGLDVLTRDRVLELLRDLRRERNLSLVMISHHLGDMIGLADRTLVLYAGRIAEVGATEDVLDDPRHPYTWGLVNAFPRMDRAKDLWGIRGHPPDPADPPPGCPFHPRCTQAIDRCSVDVPLLQPADAGRNGAGPARQVACLLGGVQTLLDVRGLTKLFNEGPAARFPPGTNGSTPQTTPSEISWVGVHDVSLTVREGEVVALVGQTGSGKTTLAKCLVGLYQPEAGRIVFEGQELEGLSGKALQAARRRLQMVFQDPLDALSPRLTVLELVREPLDIQGVTADGKGQDGQGRMPGWTRLIVPDRQPANERALEALAAVRLPVTPGFLARHAHELSGGQLQRVAIARALVLEPKLLIADEPVAMLDASEQARLLRLLKDVQNERGMGLLLISHDLALVRKVADRILVMRQGEIVEEGHSHHLVNRPSHPYTRALLQAASGTFATQPSQDI
ncbi:MAG: ABC transporter ATP-binding protein [Anaerolineae bacterium]